MKNTMPIDGKFELMALPYAADALEPVISANTLSFHHGKHLAGYVNNLNTALPGSGLEGMSIEQIVLNTPTGMHNNAGQILNHNLYFSQFRSPRADNAPTGKLAHVIEVEFGSFEAFKEVFAKAGATLEGNLKITQEPNAANPIQHGLRPLMTMDVWEHAYYLDYQNRRPDHLAALWQIIDWDVVAARYEAE